MSSWYNFWSGNANTAGSNATPAGGGYSTSPGSSAGTGTGTGAVVAAQTAGTPAVQSANVQATAPTANQGIDSWNLATWFKALMSSGGIAGLGKMAGALGTAVSAKEPESWQHQLALMSQQTGDDTNLVKAYKDYVEKSRASNELSAKNANTPAVSAPSTTPLPAATLSPGSSSSGATIAPMSSYIMQQPQTTLNNRTA